MLTPSFQTPRGACDCHMHIYDARFRAVPSTHVPARPATVHAYRILQRRLGLGRVVVVQPSAYGTDNSCTLTAISELGAARGVAVVAQDAPDSELKRLTQAGIRGIRYQMHKLPGSTLLWESLSRMAARVAPFGWHVQLQCEGAEITQHEALLSSLACDLVVDHIGRFSAPIAPDNPGVRVLRRLVDAGRCWVKLSAPYHGSRSGPPHYDDIGALARKLIRLAPQRMLWASNWPHPSLERDLPDDAQLLDLLAEWESDEALRRRILVDNPARLYGFEEETQ